MSDLDHFIKKIEDEHSLSALLEEIREFCEKNQWEIRDGKLPSISQLEHLNHLNTVAAIAQHIVGQSEKGTHTSWLTEVDYKDKEKGACFYQYLLDQIIRYAQDSREKDFIRYFIDYVKLTKNE